MTGYKDEAPARKKERLDILTSIIQPYNDTPVNTRLTSPTPKTQYPKVQSRPRPESRVPVTYSTDCKCRKTDVGTVLLPLVNIKPVSMHDIQHHTLLAEPDHAQAAVTYRDEVEPEAHRKALILAL